MHRSVSIGNILSYNGSAKLADLEYAKKVDDLQTHERRMASKFCIVLSCKSLIESQQGTLQFMSIEVDTQAFLFYTPSDKTYYLTHNEFLSTKKKEDKTKAESPHTQTRVQFSHNHLHDLESLWWVAVWVVMYNNFLT